MLMILRQQAEAKQLCTSLAVDRRLRRSPPIMPAKRSAERHDRRHPGEGRDPCMRLSSCCWFAARTRRVSLTCAPRMSAREARGAGAIAAASILFLKAAATAPAQGFWPGAAFYHHRGPRICTGAAAWSPVAAGRVNRTARLLHPALTSWTPPWSDPSAGGATSSVPPPGDAGISRGLVNDP